MKKQAALSAKRYQTFQALTTTGISRSKRIRPWHNARRLSSFLGHMPQILFSDPATRKYFGIAITLGAKDLDVTPIVDELELYQNTTDPTALRMISRDQGYMMDVVAPTNFEQFNRYLRLEGEALMDGQTLFLCKAVKTKSFRMAPEFQWLKTSRFAKHPESVYILTFMGKPDRVKWVREEALAAEAALEEH
ncbi:hypothetical protein [Corynebacterium jeikeium]|uniref:hypothetical protein n=1 Tax=Corynebacterium jeikeium TaxID=38289 RepID=UPI0008804549|nr:hypothetical protein [Corynebacterium jeikeium]SCX11829.1 hypothetical protein CJBVI_0854 [Corynebacterium jeikeium]